MPAVDIVTVGSVLLKPELPLSPAEGVSSPAVNEPNVVVPPAEIAAVVLAMNSSYVVCKLVWQKPSVNVPAVNATDCDVNRLLQFAIIIDWLLS